MPNDPDALPPVLDLEWNNHSSCKNKHNRADILEKVRVMLAAMEAHTGKVPIIYTDINFHRDILAGRAFRQCVLAALDRCRTASALSATATGLIWQWTQTGTMSGVRTEVDRNAFYGDRGRLDAVPADRLRSAQHPILGPQGRCRRQVAR